MFQKIAKHRANDASNDVHRPPLLRRGVFGYEYADNQEKCGSRKWKQGMPIGPGTTRVTQMQEGGVLSYLIKGSVKCQVHFALGK